ncbi:MAG: hypothetical protein IPL84_04475 [Chitinophagaceae bacterium]|nr:hypothetical protein [Chitinophagaceae bacterium]
MKALKKRDRVLVAVIHGIFLFMLLWMVGNSSYSSGVDETFMKKVDQVRHRFLERSPRYDHDFVFVNVSRDIKLVSDPYEFGETVITDRARLAQFVGLLADHGNRHHFLLCDIFLEFPDDDDTALLAQASRCTRYLFPYHIINDSIQKPVIPVNMALSDYVTITGGFSKFKLVYRDSLKTTPVVMLEQIDRKQYPRSFLDFRSIYPRYYIRSGDIFETKSYPYYNLGELLLLSQTDSFYHKFLEHKFIVVGNFDTDVHYSPVGNIPGPLIILNSYLSIRNRGSVSWWWALFMVAALAGVSWLLFFGKVKAPDIRKYPLVDLLMQVFVNSYVSFFGICLLLAVLSELIFSVQTSFSLLLTYLLTVKFFMDFYKKHYKKETSKR